MVYATQKKKLKKKMLNILWTKYQNYKDVFEKENVNILPQQWPYNCAIGLQESMQPPFGPIYNLPTKWVVELQTHIDRNIFKKFVQCSKSHASAPMFFWRKKLDFPHVLIIMTSSKLL